MASSTGPSLGTHLLGLVLIFTPLPLLLVNLIGSLVFALTIPLVTAGNTLLYLDLLARQKVKDAARPRDPQALTVTGNPSITIPDGIPDIE
jgi:hypothetical protein